jgi:glyoxylase-like metal-dependent hydrolase (beta-lactamase superfamily II)
MSYIIHPMVTARLSVEAGRLTYLRNYGKKIWVPCPFYLITGGPEAVLVDTSGNADLMSRLRLEPVEPVTDFQEALASVGLSLEEIRIVIHTHLMYDHCANSKLLPNARFIVQKKELDFALAPHPMFAGAYQRNLFEGLRFDVVDGDQELIPGIKLLFTPGHSPGGQSVAVSTSAGIAIITGFCCTQDNFVSQKNQAWVTNIAPEVIPPGIHTDMLQAYESTMRVKHLADIIIPFHDPIMGTKNQIPDEGKW